MAREANVDLLSWSSSLGTEGQPGQRRGEWTLRPSACPWDTAVVEGTAAAAAAASGPVGAEAGPSAEAPLGLPAAPRPASGEDLEEEEEVVSSPNLNIG